MRRYVRLSIDMPGGSQMGVSVPADASPQSIVAELTSIERQIAFGRTRRIISLDGPPRDAPRWLRWAARCATAWVEQRAGQAWASTLGRRKAEATLAGRVAAIRAAVVAQLTRTEGSRP